MARPDPWYKRPEDQLGAAVVLAVGTGLADAAMTVFPQSPIPKVFLILFSAAFAGTLSWFLLHALNKPRATAYSLLVFVAVLLGVGIVMKPRFQPVTPTLAMLFMSESKPAEGFVEMGVLQIPVAHGPRPKTEWAQLVWFAISYDLKNHTKYVSFYVPHTHFQVATVKALAPNYKNIFIVGEKSGNGTEKFGPKSELSETKNAIFNGVVYVYHEDLIGAVEEDGLIRDFKKAGATATLRGPDYLTSVYETIKAGDATPFPVYTLPPIQVVDCSKLGFAQMPPGQKSMMTFCRKPMTFMMPNRANQNEK
jgi:hypothetical protein